jgi:3-oxoacyl-[acyl-carrier protein] reductase
MPGLLNGKTAVVTGGSGDIGSDVSMLLSEEGASVVATYNRGEEAAKKLRNNAHERGLEIEVQRVDVSDDSDVVSFFKRFEGSDKPLNILVNAAGHSNRKVWFSSLDDLKTQDWLDVLKVDLIGTFNCTRAAARLMKLNKGGSIVNFSSAAGVTGHTEGLPYTAAKSAIIALTKSLARLYGPDIRVNAVAPGNIDAGSIKWLNVEQIRQLELESALQRLGKSREVSKAVLFLVSDMSSFITGQTLLVDGGI